jgi:predicted transcriptional regulator
LKDLWPYILPLPVERRKLDNVFQAVFGSKAALEVLKRASPNKRIYQKELIAELGFSNKTVIEALKKLVAAGILKEGMERRREKGKTVWTKWYMPTFQGKWLALLVQPTENISRDEAREIVTELFALYMKHIAKLCADYGIEPEIFKSTMNKAFKET